MAVFATVLAPISARADSVVDTIAVGATSTSSSAAALSPDGSRLYVADGGAGTVSVIDVASRTVLGTIPVTSASGASSNTADATIPGATSPGTGAAAGGSDPAAGVLPGTGGDGASVGILITALGMLVAGAAALTIARRRRRSPRS